MRYIAAAVNVLLGGGLLWLAEWTEGWSTAATTSPMWYVVLAVAASALLAAIGTVAGRRWGSVLGQGVAWIMILAGLLLAIAGVGGGGGLINYGWFILPGLLLAGVGAAMRLVNRRAFSPAQGERPTTTRPE